MCAYHPSSLRATKVLGAALAIASAFASGALAAGVYQWTDSKGVVHFTDDPGKIPKKYHDTVREVQPPDEGSEPGAASSPDGQPTPKPSSTPKPDPKPRPALPLETVDLRGHNQVWWQQRVQEWQTKKADAEAKLADAQQRLGQERFLNATTGNMKRIQEISDEVSTYEAQIREAENMLTEGLAEEARKAGAPPGWVRE